MNFPKKEQDLEWSPHPSLPIKIKYLVTQKNDGSNVTCFLAKTPKGVEIPEHVHETQEDILYVLEGKAKMRVEGMGEFDLGPGTSVRVPKKAKHKIYNVTEDLLVYDVFNPPVL